MDFIVSSLFIFLLQALPRSALEPFLGVEWYSNTDRRSTIRPIRQDGRVGNLSAHRPALPSEPVLHSRETWHSKLIGEANEYIANYDKSRHQDCR